MTGGNPVAAAFAKEVFGWDPRVMATTNGAFFKVAIRKHPSSQTWSFALEWNQSYRVIGFIGDRDIAQGIVGSFPAELWKELPAQSGRRMRYREEMPLVGDDQLFGFDDAEPEQDALDQTSP